MIRATILAAVLAAAGMASAQTYEPGPAGPFFTSMAPNGDVLLQLSNQCIRWQTDGTQTPLDNTPGVAVSIFSCQGLANDGTATGEYRVADNGLDVNFFIEQNLPGGTLSPMNELPSHEAADARAISADGYTRWAGNRQGTDYKVIRNFGFGTGQTTVGASVNNELGATDIFAGGISDNAEFATGRVERATLPRSAFRQDLVANTHALLEGLPRDPFDPESQGFDVSDAGVVTGNATIRDPFGVNQTQVPVYWPVAPGPAVELPRLDHYPECQQAGDALGAAGNITTDGSMILGSTCGQAVLWLRNPTTGLYFGPYSWLKYVEAGGVSVPPNFDPGGAAMNGDGTIFSGPDYGTSRAYRITVPEPPQWALMWPAVLLLLLLANPLHAQEEPVQEDEVVELAEPCEDVPIEEAEQCLIDAACAVGVDDLGECSGPAE